MEQESYEEDEVFESDDTSETSDGSQLSYPERKRQAHARSEQKRRDSLTKGYDDLQELVPMAEVKEALKTSGLKINKSMILHKSVDYIQYFDKEKKRDEATLSALKKEVEGLRIMKTNYDHIVQAHQAEQLRNGSEGQVPDDMKFQVFRQIMDALFNSFIGNVNFSNFSDLSAGIFCWLEEYWRPQALQDLVTSVLPGRINTIRRV